MTPCRKSLSRLCPIETICRFTLFRDFVDDVPQGKPVFRVYHLDHMWASASLDGCPVNLTLKSPSGVRRSLGTYLRVVSPCLIHGSAGSSVTPLGISPTITRRLRRSLGCLDTDSVFPSAHLVEANGQSQGKRKVNCSSACPIMTSCRLSPLWSRASGIPWEHPAQSRPVIMIARPAHDSSCLVAFCYV